MAKVPRYQEAGIPTHAPQLAPTDAGGLISMLETFKSQAETEAIARAEAGASRLGAQEGAGAAQKGAALPSGRPDTAAGQAYSKAARAAYMGQLENDIQEVSDEFNRKWTAGEYGEDADQWSQGFDAAVSGLTKGLDDETRAVYGPRLDSISNRTKKVVFDDFQERTRQRQISDVGVALDKVGDDLLGFARDGDLESVETNLTVYDQYLADGVEGRLFTAPEAAKMRLDMVDNLTAEAYVGDFQDAEDQRAYLNAFKEKRPSDLTPEQHERLAADMEQRLTKIEAEFSKRDAYGTVDAMNAKNLGFKEGMNFIRDTVENPNTRQNAETLWRQQQTDTERQEKIDYDVHINHTYDNILAGEMLPAEIQADATLTGPDKKSLIAYMNKQAKGEDVATDWGVYAKLMDMTPAELLEETPLSYRNQLADAEFKQVVARRTRAMDAKASGTDDTDEGTTAQALGAAVKEMGWKSNSPRAGKLHRIAREAINKKALEEGRALNYNEKTEIINQLLVEGEVVKDWAIDRDMTLVEALETPEASQWRVTDVDAVPFADRKAIETVLKERGETPTDAMILKAYNDSLGVAQ